jgi:hypothetical protein
MSATDNTATALSTLIKAPFRLYLGGSRRMAELYATDQNVQIKVTNDTDYDYYATWSEQAAAFLASSGFSIIAYGQKEGYALDSEAVAIFSNSKVQIVLRKDAEFYRTVFESIPAEIYYYYLWKSSPDFIGDEGMIQPIFNALFAAARAIRADIFHSTPPTQIQSYI